MLDPSNFFGGGGGARPDFWAIFPPIISFITGAGLGCLSNHWGGNVVPSLYPCAPTELEDPFCSRDFFFAPEEPFLLKFDIYKSEIL